MKLKKTMLEWMLIAILALTGCGSPTAAATLAASTPQKETTPAVVAATAEAATTAKKEKTAARAENWDEATHGKDVEPDYSVVFPQDSVNRIDITIGAEEWAALMAEMTNQFGAQGDGTSVDAGNVGNPPRLNGMQPPATGTVPQMPEGGGQPPAGGMQGGQGMPPNGGGGQGMLDIGGETSYVTTTVAFNGQTWNSVGLRFSGNSTLASSWRSGTLKMSFRLDFDEFEDTDPATTDQRFYGFKQLSFKSNAMDTSYLREKVAADVFSAAGVITSKTAFYEVYVDYGEGVKYFGLYTVVEVVDDTVIETQFDDDSGNAYKPEGSGASFAAGTFDEASFEKQTNKDEADWSDIQAVFTALHAETRTSDPAAWRAGLEAVFDVDAFLRWLAADTIMQNWDTYGAMAHNYYLYTNPATGKVTWIPWDNNMSLNGSRGPVGNGQEGGNGQGVNNAQGEGRGGRGGMGSLRELDLAAVTDQWPLIRFLADDDVYLAKYQQYLQEIIDSVFTPEKMAATYQNYHDLIAPSVAREESGYTQINSIDAFEQALDELIQHASDRYNAVEAYLTSAR
ncbi:MAG TPA: CotH kinase family protein [Anaerolineaceae bacterium]|nr:CotH kinase family protein [Anaerolineaceae bacterium]HPN53477.1 CotH kinase family protein [Anaerolineaceae bacterium]